jgi:hypothetical protein
MKMELTKRKARITLKGTYGERFSRTCEHWNFIVWWEFEIYK